MSIYDQPFDHKKAQNAKAANDAVDQLRQGRAAAQQARFSQQQASQKVPRPSASSRVASATKDAFTRPLPGSGATGALRRGAGKLLRFGGRLAVPIAASELAWQGGKATGTHLVNPLVRATTGKSASEHVTDFMANVTGTDDLQERMLSNDPEVSRKAVEEWRAQQSAGAERPQADAAPAASPGQIPRPGNPEAATDVFTTRNAEPAGPGVNARAPTEIPGSDYQYAGQYGDNQVLTRPTNGGDGPTEFTDDYTAFQRPRPAVREEELAQEAARVQAAREQYAANTTGSDGRRYFGGPATEKLRKAQMAEARRGDPAGVVERQLAEEGLTPEQRAAYDADPAAAYQVDAQAASNAARSRLDAFKTQFDMSRNARSDARAERTEGRRARTAALAEAESLLEPIKDYSPQAYTQMYALAGEVYDPASGESMSDVVRRLMASIETDNGMPVLDDAGQLKFLEPQQQTAPRVSPEIAPQL
tara:strand:- start:1764 stop:3191 length:1428 start_codon:yes stop_codon:yes gene_type:complete